jgi:hypothetical protein
MQNESNTQQENADKTDSLTIDFLTIKQKALVMLNYKTAKEILGNAEEGDKAKVKSLILSSIKDSKVKISLSHMMNKI